MANHTRPTSPNSSAKQRYPRGEMPAEITLRFGAVRLRVCVHWPQATPASDRSPLIVLLADVRDAPAAEGLTVTLCSSLDAVVLSFTSYADDGRGEPAAANLELAALGWAAEHAAELSANPGRLAVAGLKAAGANAARLAIGARDNGWPELRRQLLVHPEFTAAHAMPSDVIGVAPATIAAAARREGDGRRYAAVLRAAGVDVEELRCAAQGLPDGRRLAHLAGAPSPASEATPAPSSPASSPTPRRGGGSSTSTFRSRCSLC